MNIPLLDGRTVDLSSVHYDPSDFSFTLVGGSGVEDITNNLGITTKKRYFPSFDVSGYNEYLYQNQYSSNHGGADAPTVGSTSILGNVFEQVRSGQSLDIAADYWTKKADDAVTKAAVPTLVIALGAGIIWFLLNRKK